MAAPAIAAGAKAVGTAATEKVTATGAAVASGPKRVKLKRANSGTYRPVATTLTIVVGAGFLKTWLVDEKPMPERKWWVQMAILGFSLSLMAEVAPKLGKSMSYLVLTTVLFAQAVPILDALDEKKQPKSKAPNNPGGSTPITPMQRGRTIA